MRRIMMLLVVPLLAGFVLGSATPAVAQFGKLKDKLKDKAKEKVDAKTDQKIDESLDKGIEGAEGAVTGGEAEAEEAEEEEAEQTEEGKRTEPTAAAGGGSAAAEDMKLYTKYDFVPGDKVLFYDDLGAEELGEFPSRWSLERGVFEIARQHGQNWVMCTDQGTIRPRVEPGPLPDKYTVELDFYAKGGDSKGHWFHIRWIDAEDAEIGVFAMKDNTHTSLSILRNPLADKELAGSLKKGKHTMRVMATKSTLKCYIDNERVANVPAVEGFAPVALAVYLDPWLDEADNPMLLGAFRYAEGGKTLKQQLDEAGRIVTHGILFDSGSAVIKAESYKTLADIGALLAESPALRLSIEGHTDSDGAEDANVTLSQNRANSVRAYLEAQFKIDAGRLETKGWGEAKPIDANGSAEGKANNRRVELVRL